MIEHFKRGYSFASFAADVGTSVDTLYEWAKVHKSFSDAKRRGEAISLRIWERHLQKISKTPTQYCNNTATIFLMKCRFRKFGYMPEQAPDDSDAELDFQYGEDNEKP